MASHVRSVSLAAILVLGASAAIAQVPTPNGGEFRANTYTTAAQGVPDVAVDGSGHFIVVWDGFGPGDADPGIFARRYASSGYPLGPAFRVNTYTSDYQLFPAVAADAEGNFVVAWQSFGSDGDGYAIRARRFSATDVDGTASPADFAVNTFSTGWQYMPHVAMAAAGQFVVVWQGDYQDGDYYGIIGRRYDSSGVAIGAEFTVNSYFTGKQYEPEVGLAADGRFVVAWEGTGAGDDLGIFARRFDAGGNPVGNDFQVNDESYDYQTRPSLSVAADSDFVVAWQSFTDSYDILARPFNADGTPVTGSFAVNQYTTTAQFAPSAAHDAAGNFLVTWSTIDATRDGSGYSVLARRFNGAGAPSSPEFRVNSYTTGNQAFSNVAGGGPDDFLVAWESASGPGDNDTGVYAQRYGDLIYSDKVDSGSLLFWSTSQTDGGDLSVQPTAALASSAFGIQTLVDDTAGLFVQDDTPNDENRYRARFYLDPNGFDPGEAALQRRVRVFLGFEDAPQRRLLAIVLRRQSGIYALMARVRQDDNSQRDTGFTVISDAAHYVEIDWQRATGPDAVDGTFQMWIDGTPAGSLTAIDNSAALDFVRLGVFNVKSNAANGSLYVDEFVSRRANPIGPVN